ncbi:MAG: D-alanyl-D-alanine endopeptidase [Gallionellaceae bacterium]|jgi:D-alanyl-D-alanine endopeptidase (penicillin-binding protein 7)
MKKNIIVLLLCLGASLSAQAAELELFTPPLGLDIGGVSEQNNYSPLFPIPYVAPQLIENEGEINSGLQLKSDVVTAPKMDEEFTNEVIKLTSAPKLQSSIVLIYDEKGKRALYTKNADNVAPIASITKLMTAMVVLDARLPMDEKISISMEDADHLKGTHSRMRAGATLTRGELLQLALMASENRAAAALARTFPGGTGVALLRMNAKAKSLGMRSTRFVDPTGLNSNNVSTAKDLVLMVRASQRYDLIRKFTTSTSHTVKFAKHRPLQFTNTNPLVKNASWDIGVSKTGYITEAGRCLVMQATISKRPVIIVLLDSMGKRTRVVDAIRIKKWMESASVRGVINNGNRRG